MDKKTVTISVELMQVVVNYLSARPFNEVAGMLTAIQQEANPPAKPAVAPPPAAPAAKVEEKKAA